MTATGYAGRLLAGEHRSGSHTRLPPFGRSAGVTIRLEDDSFPFVLTTNWLISLISQAVGGIFSKAGEPGLFGGNTPARHDMLT